MPKPAKNAPIEPKFFRHLHNTSSNTFAKFHANPRFQALISPNSPFRAIVSEPSAQISVSSPKFKPSTHFTHIHLYKPIQLWVQLTSRLCSARPSQMGRDVHRQILLQQPSIYLSLSDRLFCRGWDTGRLPHIFSSGSLVPWSPTLSLASWISLFVRSRTPFWMGFVLVDSCHMLTTYATSLRS
jgi:hypothetical protein